MTKMEFVAELFGKKLNEKFTVIYNDGEKYTAYFTVDNFITNDESLDCQDGAILLDLLAGNAKIE